MHGSLLRWLVGVLALRATISIAPGPSQRPTPSPTSPPTHVPSPRPTSAPIHIPTPLPTVPPTLSTWHPTHPPSTFPSQRPTQLPTNPPSLSAASRLPTALPTVVPSPLPSPRPTHPPTHHPTPLPTARPTSVPSTYLPTHLPTARPSRVPTSEPTPYPTYTVRPTSTFAPTHVPTSFPTNHPTHEPTGTPTLPPTQTFSPTQPPTTFDTVSVDVFFSLSSTADVDDTAKAALKTTVASAVGMNESSIKVFRVTSTNSSSIRRRMSLTLERRLSSYTWDTTFIVSTSLSSVTGISNIAAFTTYLETTFTSSTFVSDVTTNVGATVDTTSISTETFSRSPSSVPTPISPQPSLSYSPSSLPTNRPTPTNIPTLLPTPRPTAKPSPAPTKAPLPSPTAPPTPAPTSSPVPEPSSLPLPLPTPGPTFMPTFVPSAVPQPQPTPEPTTRPTPAPSLLPLPLPTRLPTPLPTLTPTLVPTKTPTLMPLHKPTLVPSPLPSSRPTLGPTTAPSPLPTLRPSFKPTHLPSFAPTESAPPPSLKPSIAPPAPTPDPTTEYERAGVDTADTALTLVAAIIIAGSVFILLNMLRLSWVYCCRPLSDEELLEKDNRARQRRMRGLEETKEANQKEFALKKASPMKKAPPQPGSIVELQHSKYNDLYGDFVSKDKKPKKGGSSYPQPPPPPPPPSRLPPGPWSQNDVLSQSIWAANNSSPQEETKEELLPTSVVFSNPGVAIEADEEPQESFKDWIQARRNINEYARDEAMLQHSDPSGSMPRGPVLIDDSIGTFKELLGNTRVDNEGVIEVARASRVSSRKRPEIDEASANSNRVATRTPEDRAVPASLHGSVDAALGWTGELLSTVLIPDMGVSLSSKSFVPPKSTLSSQEAQLRQASNDNGSVLGDSLSSFGSIFGSAPGRSDSQGTGIRAGTGI